MVDASESDKSGEQETMTKQQRQREHEEQRDWLLPLSSTVTGTLT